MPSAKEITSLTTKKEMSSQSFAKKLAIIIKVDNLINRLFHSRLLDLRRLPNRIRRGDFNVIGSKPVEIKITRNARGAPRRRPCQYPVIFSKGRQTIISFKRFFENAREVLDKNWPSFLRLTIHFHHYPRNLQPRHLLVVSEN